MDLDAIGHRRVFGQLLTGLWIAQSLLAMAAPLPGQFLEPEVVLLAKMEAETPGAGFGWASEPIGDLDGDGAAELVIGAMRNTEGGTLAGKAYVYSGADGVLLATHTGSAFERLGFAVAGGGDVDADGVPDYLIGAPGVGSRPARVLVISGADHRSIRQLDGGRETLFGFAVDFAGDLDRDGHADLVVGAPATEGSGRVDLISGRDGSVLWRFVQPEAIDLGASVAGLDDLDGDGRPELAVSAIASRRLASLSQMPAGEAYVLSGADGARLRTLRPNRGRGHFAFVDLRHAGDLDGDGVGDLFVGDFGDKRGGRGYVFSGAGEERLRLINAESPGDGLGTARAVGDVDGDGHGDLLLGAFLNSEGSFQGGKCYLVSGQSGETLRTFTSTVDNGQLGFDVTTLGDVNADGLSDFLLTGLDLAYVIAGIGPREPFRTLQKGLRNAE
ncbi:MAG: integrin alpha [Acidobacteriota bacterium]